MVLFPKRLDEAVPVDHPVRLLDVILGQISWTKWEARYHGRLGQPPIHPRVLAGTLLYGLLTRIRSSRCLEDALQVRLDFRWLAEGRSIDHTTLSEFRRKYGAELKDLFVQVGVVARDLGFLSLTTLAFDGTRIRANNRRSGTRTPGRLREMQKELAARFEELEAKIEAQDTQDDEVFASAEPCTSRKELADLKRRQEEVAAALAELERVEQAGETVPSRVPLTDPQSRMAPNKEGGFAPNYTPLATVDVHSGLIVSADVIAMTDEDKHLVAAIEEVQEQFGLEKPPSEMLADGMMATGANLAALEEHGIDLYSPITIPELTANPAVRDDPTHPVLEEEWDQLPMKNVSVKGEKRQQLDKAAFIYDEERNCYWCPQGLALEYERTTNEVRNGVHRSRDYYKADAQACTACPLRERCLQGKRKQRRISREPQEHLRQAHARKMATPEAKEKYSRRRHPGERPFAVIKHDFGARRFLLRGLDRVRTEWSWLATAFNLQRLMNLIQSRAGPDTPITVVPYPPAALSMLP
jgi:transposase